MRKELIVLSVAALLVSSPATPSYANEFFDTLQSLLPSWPLNEPGDPIPDSVINGWRGDLCKKKNGAYADFPSKGNKCEVDAHLSDDAISKIPPTRQCPAYTKNVDPYDSDDVCDDGDQTSYNGLLCASGDETGCQAVVDAQDPKSGRWFRSPHRRWVWFNRCGNKTEPFGIDRANLGDASAQEAAQKLKFNNECAYGFSPDMNLGVLLYTLHSNNVDGYQNWL
ncbi:hypothetical protein, partial [Bradyrhizobium sp.]|uniref:hypothetical protein n=1 Tax=Bradyrhizobium sp. TaxID=376 RepID=UPI003C4076CC